MFPKVKRPKNRIYLDYAATTPLDSKVFRAMVPFWQKIFGNPSSLYEEGQLANAAIEKSRQEIAGILNARVDEIIFTAGGTESINLAIFGIAKKYQNRKGKKWHFITSQIEHHAVLNSFAELERQGFAVSYLKVAKEGFVDIQELKKNIRPETIFVSIMYANNEIGSIQPIAEIGEYLRALSIRRRGNKAPEIIFHTDASQVAGALDLNVATLKVDLLSLNGSKIYGPKQTGVLYVKSGTNLEPLIYGGGQEKNLRSGTENVPGIVGLSAALHFAQKVKKTENARLIRLRDYLYNQITKKIKNAFLNGPEIKKLSNLKNLTRLPNNLNLSFLGLEGESLMLYLDSYGISVATGSACATADDGPSHVLQALGISKAQINSSVRITLGKYTSKKDLAYVLKVLPNVVAGLRKVAQKDLDVICF